MSGSSTRQALATHGVVEGLGDLRDKGCIRMRSGEQVQSGTIVL
jgi:hypothetical protein